MMTSRSRSESSFLGDSKPEQCPLFNATTARKRAEQDAILMANRIRLLRAEDDKTRKKIMETEKKTREIVDLQRRKEERRVAKEAEDSRREAEEQEFRARQLRERAEHQQKLQERQRGVHEQKISSSRGVRQEREAAAAIIEEQRRQDEVEALAKAERVRSSAQAAARSRARSEGAKQDLARAAVRERQLRDDDERRAKQSQIEKMEREEAELMARLQRNQERHRAAYMQLEDALRQGGQPTPKGGSSIRGALMPGSTPRSESRGGTCSEFVLAAAATPSATGSSARPPRPRGVTPVAPSVSSVQTPVRTPPPIQAPPLRPGSSSRSSSKKATVTDSAAKDSSRPLSICSTASGAESGPGAAHSGTSTPTSATPPPIIYTTVDGVQYNIPEEEDLDLAVLLNA